MINPMLPTPGAMEMVLILAVIVLLFGASKLPDLARGTGRALRIFKAETKGLMDDDEKPKDQQLPPQQTTQTTGTAGTGVAGGAAGTTQATDDPFDERPTRPAEQVDPIDSDNPHFPGDTPGPRQP